MASVFQLAGNSPLTRLASGELGRQQMLPWMGCSSAARRLYWIVIRVEPGIHDGRSGFVWEGMLLHQVIFILQLPAGVYGDRGGHFDEAGVLASAGSKTSCVALGSLYRRIRISIVVFSKGKVFYVVTFNSMWNAMRYNAIAITTIKHNDIKYWAR